MPAIELYNHTAYPDEPILDALKYAKRKFGVKGDIAAMVRYYAAGKPNGEECPWVPHMHELVGNATKKFARRGYYEKNPYGGMASKTPTKDQKIGWVIIRLPRPAKYADTRAFRWCFEDARYNFKVIMEEVAHVWQERNLTYARSQSFNGQTGNLIVDRRGRTYYRRVNHRNRPIEIHVKDMLRDATPKSYADKKRVGEIIENLALAYQKTGRPQKKVSKPKFDRFGDKVSDYRNMKPNKLRSGEPLVVCPHCGDKAVILEHSDFYKGECYTHIASADASMAKEIGLPLSEVRSTTYGHLIDDDGNYVDDIVHGYENRGVLEDIETEVYVRDTKYTPSFAKVASR